MKLRSLALATLVAVSATTAMAAPAADDKATATADRADASAAKVGNVDLFLDEVMTSVELAAEGEYGKLRRGDLRRLEDSRDTIVELLTGVSDARELRPEARIKLYNAQETITAILRNDDKNRLVCQKLTNTGSRVPKTECLTIAEREHRARSSRETASRMLRMDCSPGETSRCAK